MCSALILAVCPPSNAEPFSLPIAILDTDQRQFFNRNTSTEEVFIGLGDFFEGEKTLKNFCKPLLICYLLPK